MKKITLLILSVIAFNLSNAQTNLFFDDFESYTDFAISGVGSWTLTDVDGLPTYGFTGVSFPDSGAAKSFQVFNSLATVDPLEASATSNWEGYNSTKGMVCFASVPDISGGNNDWLISPQITLAASGNSVSFWYKGCDANYSNEMFTVGVSTTDTDPGSFTIISANPESVPNNDIQWRQFTVDLTGYDNQDVYIGINCVSYDQFGFMVDDFSVDTTLLGLEEFENNSFTHSYNKDTDVLTLESTDFALEHVEIFNILGQQVINNSLSLNKETINMSDLKDGIYLTKVTINGNTKTIKILKQ